jgi:hypothetical protein
MAGRRPRRTAATAPHSVSQLSDSTSSTAPSRVGPSRRASGPSSQSTAVQPMRSAQSPARRQRPPTAVPQSMAAPTALLIVSTFGSVSTRSPVRRAATAVNTAATVRFAAAATA